MSWALMSGMPANKTGNGPYLPRALRSLQAISLGLFVVCLASSLASSAAVADEAPVDATVMPLEASAAVAHSAELPPNLAPKPANFDGAQPPDDVRKLADWIVTAGDNRGTNFVIVDKPQAKVFVFDADGKILGMAPCLVGLQPGDDSVPGVGAMTLAQISPDMRTTPAGRFVASLGPDLGKKDVLWVDYANAISLHRVVNNVRSERRPERLASPTPLDHRISWGCINVPAKFFDHVVEPAFTGTTGIVYILPEIKSMHDVFPKYYDVDEHSGGLQNVSLPASAP
jgi:hypothetical protein